MLGGVGNWRAIFGRLFKRTPPTERARRGRFGEDAAAKFLRAAGFRILARNVRVGRDELDLVAHDGAALVFVEVRARDEAALVSGYHSLTRRKRDAFRRAAFGYLRALERPPKTWRFDVVEVRLKAQGAPEIYHYANVRL